MSKQKKLPVYMLSQEEVLRMYRSGRGGLDEKTVLKRQLQFGLNLIEKKTQLRWLKILLSQFKSILLWILLVAAGLALFFGEFREVIIILLIVCLNGLIGFFQEYKAERILQKITSLAADDALAIRNGHKRSVDSTELVPGDIVFLSAGDRVPADGYILEEYDFYINDFIFTGESRPQVKKAGKLKKKNGAHIFTANNMVCMGSSVTRGEAVVIVTGTGMKTELGKLAGMAQEIEDEATPLQKKMDQLARQVGLLAVGIALLVIFISTAAGESWYEAFLFALALSVSVVPEGLPAAISVALTLGMKNLFKHNMLAKRLTAVETLGSVSVICTDKTGTITKNELTVTHLFLGNSEEMLLKGVGYEPRGAIEYNGKEIQYPLKNEWGSSLDMLMKIGVLCNDADVVKNKGKFGIVGDPTEGAIIVAAKKYNPNTSRYFTGEKKVFELPFSSERMRMSVVYQNARLISYVKGSPDVILDLCEKILDQGVVRKITSADKQKIIAKYNQMSGSALRVLSFAYRNLEGIEKKMIAEQAEQQLVWVGMMGMIDPPREEVHEAIMKCHDAGIRVVMITGDYEVTAGAIASKVGLFPGIDKRKKYLGENVLINGSVLNKMSDKRIVEVVKKSNVVFARIAPEQKLRIAGVLQKAGEILAMTGDGVNDALALKKADIGVAMGVIGTDVAKEAGDMILLDDNFASIVRGVRQGRVIYNNIKKFVHYVLTSNASELFTVTLGALLNIPMPLTAVQILATDLGTDLLPSMSLSFEKAEPDEMKRGPISSRMSIITLKGFLRLLLMGLTMAFAAVGAFLWSMSRGGWQWGMPMETDSLLYIKSTTVTFAVITMTQMANLLHSRSEYYSPFQVGFFRNKQAIGALLFSVLLLLSFVHIPFLQRSMKLAKIDMLDWYAVIGAVLLVYVVEEVRKWLVRRKSSRLQSS
jgi:Ca2+-transporting ATPase